MKPVIGIVYSQDKRQGGPIQVPTATHPTHDCAANPSFPSFEAILGADNRLHETWVTMVDGLGREHRFLIAAQYCAGCEVNRALNGVLPGVDWRGELIVMRGGRRSFVVNMGNAPYKQLARTAVRKYVISRSTVFCFSYTFTLCRFLTEARPLVAHAMQNNLPVQIPVAYEV